jgi:hypothetical protein
MKFHFSKTWPLFAAKMEQGANVSAGVPDPHPETTRVIQEITALLEETITRVKEQPDIDRKRAITLRTLQEIEKRLDEIEGAP